MGEDDRREKNKIEYVINIYLVEGTLGTTGLSNGTSIFQGYLFGKYLYLFFISFPPLLYLFCYLFFINFLLIFK